MEPPTAPNGDEDLDASANDDGAAKEGALPDLKGDVLVVSAVEEFLSQDDPPEILPKGEAAEAFAKPLDEASWNRLSTR